MQLFPKSTLNKEGGKKPLDSTEFLFGWVTRLIWCMTFFRPAHSPVMCPRGPGYAALMKFVAQQTLKEWVKCVAGLLQLVDVSHSPFVLFLLWLFFSFLPVFR
ncbi:hypothetical protein CEXT_423731 [Caerostris extrusa]|uniref:Uncharacterized protein n=1 Tax=Caerostris extrusa TaxID=172846 RepID=A0AAV4XZ99_CAEEX|nr:hypothetical protein CEXT_423731 [Caerostris extrusa]